MPTGSASRRQCHPASRPGRAARTAALVAVAAAAGIALAGGVPGAAAQGSTTGHTHQAPIGSSLPSAEELTERSRDGWELVQIVHHAQGMRNVGPGQLAMYLRQRADGSSRGYEYRVLIGDTLPAPQQLDGYSADGWELVQIVHHAQGMRNIGPGQVAVYLRHRAGG